MRFLLLFCTITTLICSARCQPSPPFNTSREYLLRTEVKPHQRGKSRFNNLWVVSSHTGAGLGDAVLYPDKPHAIKGFLNATNVTIPNSDGEFYANQEFDLGNPFPWTMYMDDVNFYAAWEPVRINAGFGAPNYPYSGFFINNTGLQWTTSPGGSEGQNGFGGWFVCNWWHNVPQLFYKLSYYDYPNPCSCADVNLIPEYL
ncbi:hypothetical protein LTR66_001544 [Elasticomyces elasticus]|nr:hypothetical protein LTR50_004917 [Elasticomyces elasticus]KAK4999395.1 hypothetical protein LTR66_001544 [Elasticomyces elasticus]